jgi:2',3'-cyclic-nucleotide 2'-phosphodiesterase (5'-nucleotidase family)
VSRACVPTLILLLLCTIATPAASQRRGPASTSAAFTLSIIATTDLHGGVTQRGERGGLALLGGYLRNLRAARLRDRGAVLLVDSGDMFQGTLESNLNEGAVVVRAYNGLGYAAAAIGNHEFDFGPAGPEATPRTPGDDPRGALKARAAEARFPFLAANIMDAATGQPVAWRNVKPSTIVTAGGIKVGIIGVTTRSTPVTTIAENIRGLTFAPLAPAITREATSLRSRGASVVIVLAHAGGRCTRLDNPEDLTSCDQMAEIVDVARQLPSGLVDVIAAGHTHQAMAQDIGGIAVVEAYSSGRAFSRVDLTIDRSSSTVIARQIFSPRDLCAREDPATHSCDPAAAQAATLVPARYENRLVTPDAAAVAAIAPAVRRALTITNEPLGVFLETPIRRADQTESALADLFADGTRESVPGADVSIGNGGALRVDLLAGRLTYGKVYEVYPFDNRIVMVTLTGDQLARIVAYNLQRREPPTEILPISGFRVDARCESGMLRVALARTSGAPIRPDERLEVATSDFIASGGDGVLAPAGSLGAIKGLEGAPILHDAVADWLRRRGGRLNENQILSPDNHRWNYPGQRPVSCT